MAYSRLCIAVRVEVETLQSPDASEGHAHVIEQACARALSHQRLSGAAVAGAPASVAAAAGGAVADCIAIAVDGLAPERIELRGAACRRPAIAAEGRQQRARAPAMSVQGIASRR